MYDECKMSYKNRFSILMGIVYFYLLLSVCVSGHNTKKKSTYGFTEGKLFLTVFK